MEMQSPAKVELTRIHYYHDSSGGYDCDTFAAGAKEKDKHKICQLRTISGSLTQELVNAEKGRICTPFHFLGDTLSSYTPSTCGLESNAYRQQRTKWSKKERTSPLIIKRNIFGHRWVLKINESPGRGAKDTKKSRMLLVVYSFVFVAILLAFACGVYYSFFLSNHTMHSLFKKVNPNASVPWTPFHENNDTTVEEDDTPNFITNLANLWFNRTFSNINSNFYFGLKRGDDPSRTKQYDAIRNYTITAETHHESPEATTNTKTPNAQHQEKHKYPFGRSNNSDDIVLNRPPSTNHLYQAKANDANSSQTSATNANTNQTTASSSPSTSDTLSTPSTPTHVCGTCNSSTELCMRTYENPYPKCLPQLDTKDPTGCGGRCKLNTQSCKLLDRELVMYQCLNVLGGPTTCPRSMWKCPNSLCISARRRCDGRWDCRDGSDERECECNLDTHFQCGNKTSCIDKRKRCDGVVDCWDRTDELYCSRGCLPEEISCANGQCIQKDKFCDGHVDCKDHSDEPKGC